MFMVQLLFSKKVIYVGELQGHTAIFAGLPL